MMINNVPDYDFLFFHIDHSNYYDLYPGYSKKAKHGEEYFFDTRKQALDWANIVIDIFSSLQKNQAIKVYRAVYLKNKEDLDEENLGESWSFDKNSAIEFGSHNNSNYLLSGMVHIDHVDWENSVKLFIQNSFDMFSGDGENELYIPYPEEVYNLEIEKIKWKE